MAEDNGTMEQPQTQEGTDVTQATVEQPQTQPRRGGRPPGNKAQQAARQQAQASDVQPATEQPPKTSWTLSEVVEIRSILEEALVEKENQIEAMAAELTNYKLIAGEYYMLQRQMRDRGVSGGN